MTPKEKAKELIDKFLSCSYYHIKEESIQCALICVDEIINSMTVATSVHLPYWQDVKQEIEKL